MSPQMDKLPLVKAGYYEDYGLLQFRKKSISFNFLHEIYSLSLENAIQITESSYSINLVNPWIAAICRYPLFPFFLT